MGSHQWQLLDESGGSAPPEGLGRRHSRVVGQAGRQDCHQGPGQPGDGRSGAKRGRLARVPEPGLEPLQQLPCF